MPISLEQRLEAAKAKILNTDPFAGRALAELDITLVDNSSGINIAATDFKNIYVNKTFFSSINFPEIVYILVHESLHAVLGHGARLAKNKYNPSLANIAFDHVIALFMAESGYGNPPCNGIQPESRFTNLSGEEVYTILNKKQQQQSKSKKGKSGKNGQAGQNGQSEQGEQEDSDWDGSLEGLKQNPGADGPNSLGTILTPKTVSEAKTETEKAQAIEAEAARWAGIRTQATLAAKAAGKLPGSLKRELAETEPAVDWASRLAEHFTAIAASEAVWTSPDRTFIGQGLYLPAIVPPPRVGLVAFWGDTSGSIQPPELNAIGNEIVFLCQQTNPAGLLVGWCDDGIQGTPQEFEFTDELTLSDLKPKGGGGTSFIPPFNWMEKNLYNPPVICIYATDLCCSYYPSPPDFPVLWLVTRIPGYDPPPPPFGEVLYLPLA